MRECTYGAGRGSGAGLRASVALGGRRKRPRGGCMSSTVLRLEQRVTRGEVRVQHSSAAGRGEGGVRVQHSSAVGGGEGNERQASYVWL